MASEDEIWEQMLKTEEVPIDGVLKRIHKDEEKLNSLKKALIYQMTHGNSEWSDNMDSASTTDIRQLMINIILHLKKEKNLEKFQKMIKSFKISGIPVGSIIKLEKYSDFWGDIFNRMIGEDFKRGYFLFFTIINSGMYDSKNAIYESDEYTENNIVYRTVTYQKNKRTKYSETCATDLSDKTQECWTDYKKSEESDEDFAHLYEITQDRKDELIRFLEHIEKIVVIEESLDQDKQWISLQQKNGVITQPLPSPHWIDDIVANDTEIIRICGEISTFLSNNARLNEITEFFRARNNGSAQFNLPMLYSGRQDTFIEPVKWYVREIIKPNGSTMVANLKTAIEGMEKSLNVTLSDDNIGKTSNPKHVYSSVHIPGVLYFQEIYNVVLLREWRPHGGIIDKNIARQYVSLVLQLHRRIQAIMVENGFQQGGKIKRTIKRRKTKKAKMRTYRKK